MTEFSEHLCECGCGEFTVIATKTDKRREQVKGQPMRFCPGHNAGTGGACRSLILDKSPAELDELKIRNLRSLPDNEAARVLDERLRFLEMQYKRNFVERGYLILEVEERELWKHLTDPATDKPYESLERWIVSAATHSRSDCFASLRAVKQLRDVPREQLMAMPRCNIGVLQSLSTSVRKRPEVVKAAQSMTAKEFISTIGQHYPDQHLEQKQAIHLTPTVSANERIEETFAMAMDIEECTSREEALEAICACYYGTHQVQWEQMKKLKELSGMRARA